MREPRPKRGRPREYDEAQVLEAVLGVFWRSGFSGATLPDLAAAAGITRPSLYSALGDKLSMYLRSLELFANRLRAQVATSLASSRPLEEELLDFFAASVDLYCRGGDGPSGCLVLCTAAAEAHGQPDIRAALAETLRVLDEAFANRFARASEAGRGSSGADAARLAQMASATVHSLAIRARAGEDRAELLLFARTSARCLAAALEGGGMAAGRTSRR